ncbi:MAG: fused MFS/spermidine synthase, partial [Actinomycetota bacterium]|nr:fused MFS/spermidine synthase [Actinomycetota bacterium]
MLLVDGAPQSHVDVGDPTYLAFEYVRRIGHVLDLAAEPGTPLDVLHLGGGALTLPRYVAATRPGSRQRVVEIDEALTGLVRRCLPLDRNWRIRVRSGDAREVLSGVRDASVDVVVGDVFAGARTPAHLTTVEYVGQVARVLRPGGVYVVNVADGPPLRFARGQVSTVRSVLPQACAVAEPAVLRGRRFGNVVVAASRVPLPVTELVRRCASDPAAARVVAGEDLQRWVGGAPPVTDEVAQASPEPPP